MAPFWPGSRLWLVNPGSTSNGAVGGRMKVRQPSASCVVKALAPVANVEPHSLAVAPASPRMFRSPATTTSRHPAGVPRTVVSSASTSPSCLARMARCSSSVALEACVWVKAKVISPSGVATFTTATPFAANASQPVASAYRRKRN
jgi:hypothetical protein